MASINQIPVSATLARQYSAVINKPGAWAHGKRVTISLYTCYRSYGFRSDYQHKATGYFRMDIEGERSRCKQFSGKRYDQLFTTYHRSVEDLRPFGLEARETVHGATVEEVKAHAC